MEEDLWNDEWSRVAERKFEIVGSFVVVQQLMGVKTKKLS